MTPPNVLCVQPWIHDFAAYDLWLRPLGLLTLASALRRAGVPVEFLDCLDRAWSDDPDLPSERRSRDDPYGRGHYRYDIIDKPERLAPVERHFKRYGVPPGRVKQRMEVLPRPDCVLVTCTMTYWYPGAFEAIRLLKRRWPAVPVILGGTYAALCTSHARKQSGADRIVGKPGLGAALRAISEVLDRDVSGSCLDIDRRPPRPAYDLIRHHGAAAVLTGRGCPYRCSYCATEELHPGLYRLPTDHIAQNIREAALTCGIGDVAFYDDALLVDAGSHLLPLLGRLDDLDLRFHTPNGMHARLITPRVARRLWKSDFRTVHLSYEPGDPQNPQTTEKVTEPELGKAAEHLLSAGYTPSDFSVYTLVGLPGQSASDAEGTLRAIQRAGARSCLTRYSPVPGTRDFQRLPDSYCEAARREPLLHNNTAFPYVAGQATLSPSDYRALRNLSRELNQELLSDA